MTRRRYEAYRDSGVEWLGEMPVHWALGRIGYSFLARSGGTPSTSDETFWDGQIPWVSAKDMKHLSLDDSEDHINERAVRESSTTMVPAGTVLMVTRSGILRHTLPVAAAERPMAINQDVKGLVPLRSDLSSRFFVYLIHGHQSELLTLWRQQGATVESLDFDAVLASQFPLPPVEEQRTIAAFLDPETAKVDALIEKKRLLIERLEEQRTALISRTMTRGLPPDAARAAGLDPSPRLKPSGVEWLGEVPEHWEVGNIRRFAAMKTGHTPSRQHPEYWEDCTIPWFGLADVWQIRDGRRVYLGETKEKISEIGLKNSAAELLPAGTVVLSRTASVGFSGIMPVPMATTQDFWNWVCGQRLRPEYLLFVLRSMQGEFARLNYGSTHRTIYQGDAASFVIPVPPPQEQAAIVEYLTRRTTVNDQAADVLAANIERLSEYRTALITAAVTGKIDVRDSVLEEVAAG